MGELHQSKKPKLHPRNKNSTRYNFPELIKSFPSLAEHLVKNPSNEDTINFFDPVAVKVFNQAILKHYYGIINWDIPKGYLCPPIPGRADYIHHLADLLGSFNNNKIPKGKGIKCLDIGVGANCIYPILGNAIEGWSFVGSDINADSIAAAQVNIEQNNLNHEIELRHQAEGSILNGILKDDFFDCSMCNPPFHSSPEEAVSKANRKLKNLKGQRVKNPVLNFGGQSSELWRDGGELQFIIDYIQESEKHATRCFLFTSLLSKKSNVDVAIKALKKTDVTFTQVIEMGQGNKRSRFAAWSYLTPKQRKIWTDTRWK